MRGAQAGTICCAQGLSQDEADALRKEAAAVNQEVVLLGDALAAKEEELGAAQTQLAQLAEQLKAATAEAARLSDALLSRCDVPAYVALLACNPQQQCAAHAVPLLGHCGP